MGTTGELLGKALAPVAGLWEDLTSSLVESHEQRTSAKTYYWLPGLGVAHLLPEIRRTLPAWFHLEALPM